MMTERKIDGKETNVWLNINDNATSQRLLKSIDKNVGVLKARVEWLRGKKSVTDVTEVKGSITRLKDLSKRMDRRTTISKIKSNKVKRLLTNFENNVDGFTPEQLKKRYNEILNTIEVDIIKNQQPKLVESIVNKSAGSPVKRTAQSELVRAEAEDALIDAKKNDAKYMKYSLASPRTWSGYDICDEFASANPTGKGRGVYLVDKVPIPVVSTHPNCRCSIREWKE